MSFPGAADHRAGQAEVVAVVRVAVVILALVQLPGGEFPHAVAARATAPRSWVMGEPPSLLGAFHDTTMASAPSAWADTLRGAPGTLARSVVAWTTVRPVAGIAVGEGPDAEVLPACRR